MTRIPGTLDEVAGPVAVCEAIKKAMNRNICSQVRRFVQMWQFSRDKESLAVIATSGETEHTIHKEKNYAWSIVIRGRSYCGFCHSDRYGADQKQRCCDDESRGNQRSE